METLTREVKKFATDKKTGNRNVASAKNTEENFLEMYRMN
jgi:hypothetical protein